MKYLLMVAFAMLFAQPVHAGLVGSLVNLDPETYSDQWRIAQSSSYLILDSIFGDDDLTFTEIVEIGTDVGGDYCDIHIGDSPGEEERVYLGDVHEIGGVYVGAVSHNTQKTRCLWAFNFETLDFLDEVTPDQDVPMLIQEVSEIDLINQFVDEDEEVEEEVVQTDPDFCTETDNAQDTFVLGHNLGLYNGVPFSVNDYCAADDVSVFEYYCEDGRNYSNQIDCEFGCLDGICIDPDANQNSCEDTDGYDLYVQGTITSVSGGQPFSASDHCAASTGELGEYSCDGDQAELEYVECEFGCVDGRCIQPETTCSDTDGSQNEFVIGYNLGLYYDVPYTAHDYCTDDNDSLFEYYCQSDRNYQTLIECEFGCVNGVCIDPDVDQFSCEDSDNGDLFVDGQTSVVYGGQSFTLSDYCEPSTGELWEVWCDGTQSMLDSHECEFGCEDGACLEQAPGSGVFSSITYLLSALSGWLSSLLGN
jgi:hypothetical protein